MSYLEQEIRTLSKEKFESLVHHVLDAKYPEAGITKVDGSGGDEGIDSFKGVLSIGPAIWQSKHFPQRLGKSQKKQILKSLKSALSARDLAMWTLCLPINLRTEEHEWFQTDVVAKYGGPEKIKLMQASAILGEVIVNRPLRDTFFPDNAMSNVLKLRQVATNAENLTGDQRADLAAEYAHQYIEGKRDLDPRLSAVLSVGMGRPNLKVSGEGLVMSFNQDDKSTHFFARNISEYNLDPINFTLALQGESATRLQEGLDTGSAVSIAAGQLVSIGTDSPLLKSFFEGKNPQEFQLEVRPILPQEIAAKDLALRVEAGRGPTARIIPYIPLTVSKLGRREITLTNSRKGPIEITLTLRPHEQNSIGIKIRPVMRGAQVQAAHEVLQFLDELESSGEFRVFTLEPDKPLAEVTGRFTPTAPISAFVKAAISDAATVASFFRVPLVVPDQILKADAENLSFLKRIATGESFSGISVTVRLIKKAADQEMFLAALKNTFDFVFENMLNPKTVTIFGREIDPGTVAFEAQGAVFDSPEALREAYLHASEQEDLLWRVRCPGPCRFVSRSAGLDAEATSA